MLPFRRPPATSKLLPAAASVPQSTDLPADPATPDPATPVATAANRDSSPHVDYDLFPLGIREFDHYIGPAAGNKRFHVH